MEIIFHTPSAKSRDGIAHLVRKRYKQVIGSRDLRTRSETDTLDTFVESAWYYARFAAQELAYSPTAKGNHSAHCHRSRRHSVLVPLHGRQGTLLGIDRYGESAPGQALFHALGITVEALIQIVRAQVITDPLGAN